MSTEFGTLDIACSPSNMESVIYFPSRDNWSDGTTISSNTPDHSDDNTMPDTPVKNIKSRTV